MTVHYVKSWKHLYAAAITGEKTHDMRRVGDRDYKVGDVLILREYDQNKYLHTGREGAVEITYITSPNNPCALSGNGLKEEYCILSIKLIGELKDKVPELPLETQDELIKMELLDIPPRTNDKVDCAKCNGLGYKFSDLSPCEKCNGSGCNIELKWIDNKASVAEIDFKNK